MVINLGGDELKLVLWAIDFALDEADSRFEDDPEWPIDKTILSRLVSRMKGTA